MFPEPFSFACSYNRFLMTETRLKDLVMTALKSQKENAWRKLVPMQTILNYSHGPTEKRVEDIAVEIA